MKLPNGFGNISKLSGKRRNPWRARKTCGWETIEDDKLVQKFITIGYYPTRQDALQALSNFNENPYDIQTEKATFEDVYAAWSKEHFEKIVPSAARTWKSAYKYCAPIYKMKMKDLRVNHLEQTIKNAKVGDSTKSRIKSLFNQMFRYAMRHEIVDKNYAEICNAVKSPMPTRDNVPFTKEELQILWNNISFPFADMVLIGVYSGWRPQELATLKIEDIDLKNHTMCGGLKTDAGRNRIVPIHSKIYNLIEKRYDPKNKFLFYDENGQQGKTMTYDKYRGRFNKINEKFGFKHRPHETRHTFITMAKEAQVNDYVLKLMVGHAIEDITEKVYTHRTLEQLKTEIEKIK
ncbi:MAG: recombinase XerD [Firmicutes bacterium HGW-Firmicutes-4]|jgi:integrase|nr:MAG: recombinase XerD [Ignavibacteriae bacterium HGW-Ignavibacteriae-4]PKM61390.1 MAG: recombinase XerD [Firmicutes bacterium HGW-Firmicutes-4]